MTDVELLVNKLIEIFEIEVGRARAGRVFAQGARASDHALMARTEEKTWSHAINKVRECRSCDGEA